MTHKVKCQKLGIEAEGLDSPPYPGEMGQRIYENISKQAWETWLSHQTMLINEYRLNLMEPKTKEFLFEEMEKFLFAGESEKPPGYVNPEPDQGDN